MRKIGFAVMAFCFAAVLPAASRTVALEVKGWTCGSCAASTRIALNKLDGVDSVNTDNEQMEAIVPYD